MRLSTVILSSFAISSIFGMQDDIHSMKRKRQANTEFVDDKKARIDEAVNEVWATIPIEIQELIFSHIHSHKPTPGTLYKIIKGLKKLGLVNKIFAETAEHMLNRVLDHIKLQYPLMAEQLFVRGCGGGDSSLVAQMIAHEYDVNKPDITGINGLMAACEHKQFNIAKLLINSGATVDLPGPDGITALMIACKQNSYDCVELLLNAQADVCRRDNGGSSALHYAVQYGSKRIVMLLMENDARIDIWNHAARTPFHYAIEMGRADLIKVMLKKQKAPIKSSDILNMFGWYRKVDERVERVMRRLFKRCGYMQCLEDGDLSALAYRAVDGNYELLECVLDSQTDTSLEKNVLMSGLSLAVASGNVLGVEMLLQRISRSIAFKPASFPLDRSLLMRACLGLPRYLIEKLLEAGQEAFPNPDLNKLLRAIIGADHEVVEIICCDNTNLCSSNENLPLLCAILLGDITLVTMLMRLGCSIKDVSVLHAALDRADEEILRLLIHAGMPIKDDKDSGLLPVAVAKCSMPIIKLLLEHGAQVNNRGVGGDLPLSLACEQGQTEVVKMLCEHGAKIKHFCLERAASNGHKEICHVLLDRRPELVNKRNTNTGCTLLEQMILDDKQDMVKLLLERGADRSCLYGQSFIEFAHRHRTSLLEYARNFNLVT